MLFDGDAFEHSEEMGKVRAAHVARSPPQLPPSCAHLLYFGDDDFS